jgi:hypothetical protein
MVFAPKGQRQQQAKRRPNESVMPGKVATALQITFGESDAGDHRTQRRQGGKGKARKSSLTLALAQRLAS